MTHLRLSLCLSLLMPTFVAAQAHPEFATVGDWTVRSNPANGNGCYMEKTFESGTLVQIGVVPDQNGAFFAAYNAAFGGVVDGEAGSVLFDFGDSRFQGDAVGAHFAGLPGGYAFFDNPEFASEFGKRTSVLVQGGSGETEDLDLSGSMKGLHSIKACRAQFEES
ncbi:hypothetical protein [Shimia sagamensis]|uniref:Uncharacterized protein n=1 Tax=Shimia sagamensis TaxID=1566352 RepID=A0ABY1PBU4_9RHOB|nr:hypothetical protein [Shimia sagamensis]SMP30970.1 hypothetical protein SAMN06265373_107181 [Shimia sagamensis]